MKENYLDEKLIEYGNSDAYPFHMPGHKRRSLSFPNPYETDITEIYGFDNLHHPTGILKEAQDRVPGLPFPDKWKQLWAFGRNLCNDKAAGRNPDCP